MSVRSTEDETTANRIKRGENGENEGQYVISKNGTGSLVRIESRIAK